MGKSKAISRAAAAGPIATLPLEGPATASATGLTRLFLRRGRCDRRRRPQTLQRVQRIIQLEVLDALFLEVLGLGEQVAAKVGLADELAVLVVGVRQLRHDDVRLDSAGLNRAARRRVIARRGEPESAVRPGLNDGLDRSLAEARL